MAGTVAYVVLTTMLPGLAIWRAGLATRSLLAGACAAQEAAYLYVNWQAERRAVRTMPAVPISATLFCYALLRSTALALMQGGIRWRGTLYPLRELRSQTGRELDGGA